MPVFMCAHIEDSSPSRYHTLLADLATAHGGELHKLTQSTSCLIFHGGSPVACALNLRRQLPPEDHAVCIALGIGEAHPINGKYGDFLFSTTLCIAQTGSPGQVLLGEKCAEFVRLPKEATIRNLGRHLLKDLSPPQNLYQLTHPDLPPFDYPPLRTLSTFRHNLLPQSPPLIGRRKEIEDLGALLQDPDVKLVTITGPGGVGKSRLALHVAAEYGRHFRHGAFFIPLASLNPPPALVAAIADTLGFIFQTRPAPRAQLFNYLRWKSMLLVMDSYEHLLPNTDLLADLLQSAFRLKLLVTSREPLRLPGELVFTLRGLDYPPHEDEKAPERYEALQLFVHSARRVRSTFALTEENRSSVIRICHRVGGLPLGLTLAATWMRFHSAGEIDRDIQENLDILTTTRSDIPPRHRSLRAVFEHSWRLLTEREQQVFASLSIFQGGFEAGAAAAITNTSTELLTQLADKSLLRRSHSGRLYIHPSLRPYAAEKLAARPQEAESILERHALYYADCIQQVSEDLWAGEQQSALEAASKDLENIRAAWQWVVEHMQVDLMERMIYGLSRFFQLRSQFDIGYNLSRQALEAIRTHLPPESLEEESQQRLVGRLLSIQGLFAYLLSQYTEAHDLLTESLVIFQRHGMGKEMAFTIMQLGIIAYRRGDLDEARTLHNKAQALFEDLDLKIGIAITLKELGNLAYTEGEYEEALRLYECSAAIRRAIGDTWGLSQTLNNSGSVANFLGNYEEAQAFFRESLRIKRNFGNRWGISYSLNGLGMAAYRRGAYDEARRYFEEGLSIRRDVGNDRAIASSLNYLGEVFFALGEHERAQEFAEQALSLQQKIPDPSGTAFSHLLLGRLASMRGDFARAGDLLRESLSRFEDIGDLGGILAANNALASVLLTLGNLDEARQLFRANLAFCSEPGNRGELVESLAGLGDIVLIRGDTVRARGYYRDALREAHEMSTAPQQLRVLESVAALRNTTGDLEEAAQLLYLILHHPASPSPLRERAQRRWVQIQPAISLEALTSVQDGTQTSLTAVVEETLCWLKAT